MRCPKETVSSDSKSLDRLSRIATLLALLFAGLSADTVLAQSLPGPQGPEQPPMRRQLWLVPSQDTSVLMRTLVFRPPGAGPFPLVIINHGSVQSAEMRAKLVHAEFRAASQWFVARGYAVALPQRPGHGETGGPYFETNSPAGGCDNADYRRAGLATADTIYGSVGVKVWIYRGEVLPEKKLAEIAPERIDEDMTDVKPSSAAAVEEPVSVVPVSEEVKTDVDA